jgi:hypothetical protein
MANSIEEEIFKRIDSLQRQFYKLKEKTEKALDNNAMFYRWCTKIERKITMMCVRVKKVIDRIDRVLEVLEEEKN